MTREEAAAALYDAALKRNKGEDDSDTRRDVITRLVSGDSQTIRAVSIGASPKGIRPSRLITEATNVLIVES
jgi:hypothetical protein